MVLCVTKSAIVFRDNFSPFLCTYDVAFLFYILNIAYIYSVPFLFSLFYYLDQTFIMSWPECCKSIQWATSLLPECSS